MGFGHWQAKTKLRSTDRLYSTYRRTKADWKCDKCGRDCSENHQYLTVSHFFGRRKESVRFDDENCDALCRKCHDYYEVHKEEYKEWKLQQMGENRYNLLVLRANTVKPRDDEMDKIMIKQMMKELSTGR